MIYKFSLIEKLLLSNDIIPHPFADASSSVGLGFALGTSIKLKLVDELSLEMKGVDEIAQRCQVNPIGAELILDCLEALGYVRKDGRNYGFTKRGFKSLSQASPQNFRHFILFCDYLYKGYLTLDETIRLGHRAEENMLEKMSEREWELFSRAMIDISRTNKKEVAGKIPIKKTYRKMVDLGGSHGLYSIELCMKYPELKSTVMDLPPVKKYADECIDQFKAAQQVDFLAADFMKNDLPQSQDVILSFNIIHGLNPVENEELAKKAYRSLNNGGIYVVLDQIKGIGGSSQLSRATTSYMALNLLHQAGGKTYSLEEIKHFTQKAGFTNVEMKKLNAPGFGLVIVHK